MTKDGPLLLVLLAVASGAALGACARWGLSYLLNARWGVLPLGTLTCNLLGAFCIGLVLAWLSASSFGTPMVRLFLVTGLLGGLTTFSTFSMENVALIESAHYARALLHGSVHLFGSLVMTVLGCGVGHYLTR